MPTTLRADPQLGIFETMLVLDGEPVELEAHLRRLAGSLAELYGVEPPPQAAALVRARTAGIRRGRVRLTVAPGSAGLAAEASAEEIDTGVLFPPPARGPDLRSFVVEGGLGPHKWADRSALPTAGGGELPLLVEPDGEVLEAAWANVFSVAADCLTTPPADGRILPGVTRAVTIELARRLGFDVREAPISLEELAAAEEVLLTGSVRGIETARSLDGRPLPTHSPVGTCLATALSRRWNADDPPAR